MGLGMWYMQYMSEKRFFDSKNSKVLDIGSQNLLSAEAEDIVAFAKKHGYIGSLEYLSEEAKRISYFSIPRPGERTSYVSELFDLTDIEYHSFDICPALKTEIFELNFQSLPDKFKNYFDVVLNFGTTEHILNQYNAFKIMHEATKIGGRIFHQVPTMGWFNHGYVCYHSLFFQDIGQCNKYEVTDIWLNQAGVMSMEVLNLDVRPGDDPLLLTNEKNSMLNISNNIFPNYNINVLFTKNVDAEFKIPLELQTSHSAPDPKFKPEEGIALDSEHK